MNIAIITPTLNYGGAERQVEFLALGFKQKGHVVTVYCLRDGGPIADILIGNNIPVVKLYSKLINNLYVSKNKGLPLNKEDIFRYSGNTIERFGRLLNEFWAAIKLFLIFLKHRPEVVHLYQNQTKMAIIASKFSGVRKVIYTETSLIGEWFTQRQLFIMKFFWKFCDAFIVLSSAMENHILELHLIKRAKLHLIPTMFPYPKDFVYPTSNSANPIRIGTIGRLTPGKGLTYFLRAASLINRKFKDVKFVIAGEGNLKPKLQELSCELGIEKNTNFMGHFKNIEDAMSQIDIFVLSSLSEGMPLVLLEAMAYGKPIIATDVGGVSEIIKDGQTGFLVPLRDYEGLAKAVNSLIDNPQKGLDFVAKTVQLFKDKYDSDKIIPKIESLYLNNINSSNTK